ncbi:MAG TPA: RsmD family RNA methyltransferase, partial [bacterium]|nr:RsmD family RNA methyltransferase [bacterium]
IIRNHIDNFNNKIFLDVFSGSGNIGIEAVSNGFLCVFVEKFKSVYEILKYNLEKYKIQFQTYQFSALKKLNDVEAIDKNIVIYGDALKTIKLLNSKFDVIFIDPPYNSNLAEKILSNDNLKNIIHNKTLIIIETSKQNFNANVPDYLKLLSQKKYGEAYLYIFQK